MPKLPAQVTAVENTYHIGQRFHIEYIPSARTSFSEAVLFYDGAEGKCVLGYPANGRLGADRVRVADEYHITTSEMNKLCAPYNWKPIETKDLPPNV